MLRRSHKKSRRGAKCDECRRRHIRCDQHRPSCINCTQTDRSCNYRDPPALSSSVAAQDAESGNHDDEEDISLPDHIVPPATTLSTSIARSRENNIESPLAIDGNGDGSIVNLTHLELFNHFGEIIGALFAGRDTEFRHAYLQHYHKAAFAGVYLMHEMLAFAAKHLSLTGPQEKCKFYADQATMLQTRALSLFSASLLESKPDTVTATFLFSSLLGTHVLSDTMTTRHMELDSFLDQFKGYLKVHRGVRPIFDEYRSLLLESELKPILIWGWNISNLKGAGSECQPLREMITQGHLDTPVVEAYTRAIDVLQSVIDGYKSNPAFPGPAAWVTVWLSVVRPDYTELLLARQPEALIVFAYYGAMIHCFHRDLWLVGESGKHIIELVAGSLGPTWKPWLRWPLEIGKCKRLMLPHYASEPLEDIADGVRLGETETWSRYLIEALRKLICCRRCSAILERFRIGQVE